MEIDSCSGVSAASAFCAVMEQAGLVQKPGCSLQVHLGHSLDLSGILERKDVEGLTLDY